MSASSFHVPFEVSGPDLPTVIDPGHRRAASDSFRGLGCLGDAHSSKLVELEAERPVQVHQHSCAVEESGFMALNGSRPSKVLCNGAVAADGSCDDSRPFLPQNLPDPWFEHMGSPVTDAFKEGPICNAGTDKLKDDGIARQLSCSTAQDGSWLSDPSELTSDSFVATDSHHFRPSLLQKLLDASQGSRAFRCLRA